MKKKNIKNKRNKFIYSKNIDYTTYENNMNIRRKSLSILDSKLKYTFTNLNTLLEKINNVKELVVFNKYDTRDLRSLKNLDNNALLFSKIMKEEIKKTSDYLYAYNLSSLDLDNFMNNLEKKSQKEKKKENNDEFIENDLNNNKKHKQKDSYHKLKKEFDLANFGKNKSEKIKNNTFLKDESKLRDLYNLKLELFLKERRKKLGEEDYYDPYKKAPNCLRDKDKRINQRYATIKSKYNEMYQISKSFEIEEGIKEMHMLSEEDKKEDDNKIKRDKDSNLSAKKNDNYIYNIEEYTTDNNNINNHIQKTNVIFNKKAEYIDNTKKRKKPLSAHLIKSTNDNYCKRNNNNNSQLLSFNNTSQVNINTIFENTYSPKGKRNRVSSGKAYQRKHYVLSNNINNQSNFNTNKSNRPISPNNLTSKQTLYSSTISSRPYSAFSSLNANSIYHYKNKTFSRNENNTNNSKTRQIKRKSFFTNYINQINKIIKYSNYTTKLFKKSTSKLKNKKLFQKSNSQIFERTNNLNIEKLRENLKLKRSANHTIDDKRLIYNNSKKVKLMLTSKNRKILNTILVELIDKQRRVNNFYCDLSHYEKMIQKFERNKKYRKFSNESMNIEKRFDRESILEIFKQDEEKIMEYLKEINDRDKYDEEEWKHILLKHKNMRIINSSNINNNVINGNLHKKHLVSKFKKEKK